VRLRRWILPPALVLALAFAPKLTLAQALVADLTSHLIAITTGFSGAEVTLFGAAEGEGEVIVVVRGPDVGAVVREKRATMGVWLNRDRMIFDDVPGFYAIASTKTVEEIAPTDLRERHKIGVETLNLKTSQTASSERVAEFREALIRSKQKLGLYPQTVGAVTFVGARLFRTTISFPATVPTGAYQVSVFLVRDGRLIGAQTTPLLISKLGVSAEVVDFARKNPLWYGLVAVAVAVLAGWASSLPFRRA
jgi:uncharacterized protein (TIGR02186 family)